MYFTSEEISTYLDKNDERIGIFYNLLAEDKVQTRYPGGGACGCENQNIHFYHRGGLFPSHGILPHLTSPPYPLSPSSAVDSLPGKTENIQTILVLHTSCYQTISILLTAW